jgi:hypothetical protein
VTSRWKLWLFILCSSKCFKCEPPGLGDPGEDDWSWTTLASGKVRKEDRVVEDVV